MQYQFFLVGDEPYCLWDENIAEQRKSFFKGLDTGFFTYLLDAHIATSDEKRSSAGIRIALHHAIETMFSLLGAFAQAPQCPYAWISCCRTSELREVVRRINKQDDKLYSSWNIELVSWEALAKLIFQAYKPGTPEQQRTIKGFAKSWRNMSNDLLNEVVNDEYNAIKHGFRMTLGGFKLDIGTSPTSESSSAPEMISLGESEFGASFFKIDRLKGRGGCHLQSTNVALNWSPDRDMLLLQLAQFSIHNIASALRTVYGAPARDNSYLVPVGDDVFDKPWSLQSGALSFTVGQKLEVAMLPELSKDEIRKRLWDLKHAQKKAT